MTGFFAVKRSCVEACLGRLSALGFKILIDIIISSEQPLRVREIPFQFRRRLHGESKLSRAVIYEFCLFFIDKKIGRYLLFPARFISFCLIGSIGVGVHLLLLTLAIHGLQLSFILGQSIATLGALISNFSLNNWITYGDQSLQGYRYWLGLLKFSGLCSIGVIANIGVASFLNESYQSFSPYLHSIAGIVTGVICELLYHQPIRLEKVTNYPSGT